ncbi:hypothetical protein BDC45DRAFT_485795 [Circinella umbellata]|nr:hypothetical protein BDC45DRAFT_485795 [Circinella umbellata]
MVFFYQLRLNLTTYQYGPIDLFQKLPNVLFNGKEQENISLKNQKQWVRSKSSLPEQGKQSNNNTSFTVMQQQQQQNNAPPPTPFKTKSFITKQSKKQQEQQRKSSSLVQNDFRFGEIIIESIEEKNQISITQCGSGIVHLYRETKNEDISILEQENVPIILCVLAIPTYMQPLDFIKFTGTSVKSYRIIRDHTPNKYTALLKFDNITTAKEFYKRFNGKQFNVMEPELCHVVYLRYKEFDAFNHNNNILELPTCPVCLERMDESVSGLMTIQCEHTFQCYCLSKWGDGNCPTCNYSIKPVLDGGSSSSKRKTISKTSSSQLENAQCFVCGSTESLWICLICGHIGCGRYHDAHAYDHYMETGDSYALEIKTQQIWDYTGDRYIHRLIQNMIDGSLVELPSATNSSVVTMPTTTSSSSSSPTTTITTATVGSTSQQTLNKNNNSSPEKLDAMSVEYTYMLTSQLESQREHYEEQLSQIQIQISSLTAQVKNLMINIKTSEKEHDELIQIERETRDKISKVEKERMKVERKLDGWKMKCKDKENEWHEEQELSDSLLKNNQLLLKNEQEKDQTIEGLNNHIGTSADQDSRFSNKNKKLLKSLNFPPEFDEKIDMKKVKLDVIKPWITTRITELLGFEDELVIGFTFGLLEEKNPDPKMMQINLTGFLEKNTQPFILELWKLLSSAQQSKSGIPQKFLEEKKQEIMRNKEHQESLKQRQESVMDNIRRRKEAEEKDYNQHKQQQQQQRYRSPSPSRRSYHHRSSRHYDDDRRRHRSPSPRRHRHRHRSRSPPRHYSRRHHHESSKSPEYNSRRRRRSPSTPRQKKRSSKRDSSVSPTRRSSQSPSPKRSRHEEKEEEPSSSSKRSPSPIKDTSLSSRKPSKWEIEDNLREQALASLKKNQSRDE